MSRYISFRAPDDLAAELEREGSNRSQAICDLLREALGARLSRSGVQDWSQCCICRPGDTQGHFCDKHVLEEIRAWEAAGWPIRVPGVQRVPDPPPQAPSHVSALGNPICWEGTNIPKSDVCALPLEPESRPIPKNQQLATLAGPRCPRHRDFLWAQCRRLECKREFGEYLERRDNAEWMERKG